MTPPTWLFWPVVIQPSGTVTATGGTVKDSGGYRYHTFTSSGTLDVTAGGDVEVLLVGGGGAGNGNSNAGGGGGAGGVRLLDGANSLTLSVGAYVITVGGGGVSGLSNTSGQASSIIGPNVNDSALGGGAGGRGTAAGANGGSGGGGGAFASNTTNTDGGLGTSGQGNDGGNAYTDDPYVSWANDGGGGGGGAGASGGNGAYRVGGNGGDGTTVWGTTYGGGGGGGVRVSTATRGLGGSGGGGDGGADSVGAAGTANTGGGGGGGSSLTGGAGGSGIVIVRYPLSAVVLWAPTDLTNLVGWWDADDSSTLYDATSGGNLVTTHNAQVKRWEDKSGNANHATQDNANGPKIQTTSNTLNSKPVMRFVDASNSILVVAASSDFVPDLLTVVAVIRTSSSDTNRGIAGRWGTAGNYWFMAHRGATSPYLPVAGARNSANSASFNAGATTQVNDGNGRLFGMSMESGGDLRIFVDAVEEATTSQTSHRTGTTEMYIGSYNENGSSTGLDGDIAEMVMFRSSADSDREKVEGYLAHKWGLESNLPSTHPYKNSPP